MNLKRQEATPQIEIRRHPRATLEVDIVVHSKRAGPVPGRTLEISESGISAILAVELFIGEAVELDINLPLERLHVKAVVRNKNIFRHGFEFARAVSVLRTNRAPEIVQANEEEASTHIRLDL
ncbi:MAG TPA: PilZ domain-containing protein [Candidatus Deferrimicrobiaceae bacterium]|nr:PilZ domain-containing protein [Candidatus Deferrimicrobiaceae bacterium]